MGPRLIARLASVAVLALGWALAAPAAPAEAASSAEAQHVRAAGAPWCGRWLWAGPKVPTGPLAKKLEKLENVIDTADIATDAATLVLITVSGGVAAVPAVAVKGLAKVGARVIIRMVKKLRKDILKINKRKAGVRLSIECVGGVLPYPSLGAYT